jgi:MFS family permease/uncharacterized SAM-dependent methyltransferase
LEDVWRFFSRSAEGGDIMKYAYLAPGDRFGAITKLPAYYVTEDELRTLDEQVPLLAESLLQHRLPAEGARGHSEAPLGGAAAGPATADVAAQMHIVEWGPGPGHVVQRKTVPLLESLARGPCQLSYEAVDVSAAYASDAADVVACALAKDVGEDVMVTEGDFFEHAAQQAERGVGPPTCMFFWGVTFGNFDGAERERLIASIKAYDLACFTVDHNLDLESLSRAYDMPQNHSFIMGALEHIQKVVEEVEGEEGEDSASISGFNLDAWEAEVRFEPQHWDASGAVDELLVASYVRSLCDQTLVFQSSGVQAEVVRIAAGERFRVLQSRKYSEGRVRELFEGVSSERPKVVSASGVTREGSRIGLLLVSGQQLDTRLQDETTAWPAVTAQTTTPLGGGGAAASKLQRGLIAGVVLLALLVDYMLLTVLVPLLPHIQEDFDVSIGMTGLLLAMKPLVQLIADPVVAPFTDRGHIWPLLTGLALEAATASGFALSEDFAALMASRGLQGVASAMILNAGFAMISRAFADDDATRGIVMSMAAVGITAGAALGPVLSGELFRIAGMQFTFVVAAGIACIAFAVSASVISCIKWSQHARSHQASLAGVTREELSEASDEAGKQSWTRAFGTILSDSGSRAIYLSIFACNVVYASVEATLALWMERDLGWSTSSVGRVFLG